ncbi:MAG TPA: VWA domain-containing protein, partial [Dehalococcoidia bacterium]
MRCKIALVGLPLVVALALLAGSAAAQDASLTLQIANVSDAGYPKAQAVVTIEDTSSAAAPALSTADVQVAVDGAPAKVLSAELASSETSPLDVLFLIDTSGSMAGRPIALAKDAAKGFIQQLAPQDRVAVIGFSDQVAVLQDYTTDRAAASTVIDGLVAQGNTALYQATAGAAVKAASSSSSRRAIILLSDGANEGSASTTTRQDALDAVTKVGVPVFAVGEGTDIDRDYLQQVADGSHGRYLEAPDPKQLGDLYAGIARLLRSQYVITFDASSVKAAGDVPVSITIASGTRTASAQTSYHAAAPVAPQVTLTGIRAGESLTAPATVTAEIAGAETVSRATFRVDGQIVAQSSFPPYTYVYDPHAFGGGSHQLSVTVESPAGPVDASVSFSSAAASGSGGINPMLFVGAGAALLALLAVALAFVLRTRRRKATPPAVAQIAAFRKRTPASEMPPEEMAPPPTLVEVVEEVKGILISRAGSDLGSEYVVGGQPVSIGSGEHCAVRIADRGLSAVE